MFDDLRATLNGKILREGGAFVIKRGASIVDIGGVKAGPGEAVDAQEEIDRVVPQHLARICGVSTQPGCPLCGTCLYV